MFESSISVLRLTVLVVSPFGQNHNPLPKTKMDSTLIVLVVLGLVHLGSGLYFHIGETERKCFIEEVPDDTLVAGMFDPLIMFRL